MPARGEPDLFGTPIFIQNFNQLSFLKGQIAWLRRAGYRNVTVIDNNSTYPPLLRYYEDLTSSGAIKLVRRLRNDGKLALWSEHIRGIDGPFVFTSSDVVPDACCPADVVAHLAAHLRDNPQILKAGLGLRIDDLPAAYKHRQDVLLWEGQFWRAPVARGLFLAPIDATFALYRRGSEFAREPAVRTGWPYLARHGPWYSDSANPSEEERNYAATIAVDRGHWGRERLPEWLRSACAALASAPARTLVHLACGPDVFPGWINVDVRLDVGADITFDLERCARERLAIDADSVDGFFMGPAFARIDGTRAMLQELYRIARPDARFVIRVGQETSGSASGGPARRYRPDSFNEYGQPAHAGRDDPYAADWLVKRVKLVVDPELARSESDASVIARMGDEGNVVREMVVELRAVKPSRPRDPRFLECPAPTISRSPIDADSRF